MIFNLRQHIKPCGVAILGSAILAFGLYNIHSISGVTEGGVLGLTLLLHHSFHISPAVSGFIMNVICYALGWKLLGKNFIAYSFVSATAFSLCYNFCEKFPPLWPQLANMPLAASVIGAFFVGTGAGLCVKIGGAPSGDDALAMSVSHITGIAVQWIYLVTDISVLLLSLSYIPLNQFTYSLLTVVLSGQILGFVQKLPIRV